MAAVPWPRDTAPPKPEPHLRTWQPDSRSAAQAKIPEVNADTLSGFLKMVTESRELIRDFESNKRPGRPPREIVEARANLALFDRLSRDSLVSSVSPPAVNIMKRTNRKPLDKPRAVARAYARSVASFGKGYQVKSGATRFRSRLVDVNATH